MPKLKPKNFVGCNLNDQRCLDKNGFLIDSYSVIITAFDDIILEYSFDRRLGSLSFSIYGKAGYPAGIINYSQDYPPLYRLGENFKFVEKQVFVDYFLQSKSDFATWILWNI